MPRDAGVKSATKGVLPQTDLLRTTGPFKIGGHFDGVVSFDLDVDFVVVALDLVKGLAYESVVGSGCESAG